MEGFAKIFESEKRGQILVQRTQNDEGDAAISYKVDTHPEDCAPTESLFVLVDGEDAQNSLNAVDLQQAERIAEMLYNSVEKFFN